VLLVGPDAHESARRLAACDEEETARVRSFFERGGEVVSRPGGRNTLSGKLQEVTRELEDPRASLEGRQPSWYAKLARRIR
jgi:hypothetical protein